MTTVIYHNDIDGFFAGMAAWKKFGEDAIYLPLDYDNYSIIPPLEGCTVYILDLSLPVTIVDEIELECDKVIIIDHHASTIDTLGERDYVKVDVECSAAVLAWKYFHPHRDIPWLYYYVQDRDLWYNELVDTEEVNVSIESYPREFIVWAPMLKEPITRFAEEGAIIKRYKNALVERILSNAEPAILDGYACLMVNSPILQSELGGALASKADIGVVWYKNKRREVVYSLRSIEKDVKSIAKKHGGGGHLHAAGFTWKE
jgi:hypothetical protein